MSDADTLRKAARKLREASEKATPKICESWIYFAVRHIARNCEIDCEHTKFGQVEAPDDGQCHDGWDRYDDSPWVHLMQPHVAEPLAKLLLDEADIWDRGGPIAHHAVATAEAILGGGS